MTQSQSTSLRGWLEAQPFALAMSSGFFSFFAHAGMLSALLEAGLRPMRGSGSSAGALVLGLWAGGLEVEGIRDELHRLRRQDFWDPRPGPGLLRGRRFRRHVERLLQHQTFEQARIPLGLSTFDVLSRRTRVLRRGPLARAICASCAVPLLFQPVWVDGRPLLDGGVLDRPGLSGMPAGTRLLYHHITARSPWRRPGAQSMQIPSREQQVALCLTGLPRLHPFALERGPEAFTRARAATRRALELPLEGPVLSLAV